MESSGDIKDTSMKALVPVVNQLHNQAVQIYKKQDETKKVAEYLNNSLAVYQAKVGTLALVKKLKTGLPSLAVLKEGSHAYDTTKKGLTLQTRLETLYRQYSSNIEQLLFQLESLEINITALEQKFKMMIDDTSLRFDYKFFEVPLQKVMTMVNRISADAFEDQVKAVFNEVYSLRMELADLSTELPQEDSQNMKQEEKERKIKEAKDKINDVIKEKADLEANISKCDALIRNYTDKISSFGDTIFKLKEQIEEIDAKITEYQGLKYKEAEVVTNRLNELRDIEHEQLKQQQSQLTNDKDRLREKQQKLLEQIEDQIADAMKKLQASQQAGQTHVDFHLIFLLDESGSMAGNFTDVEQSFQHFISARKQKNQRDIVSVVKFNSVGTIIYEKESITADFSRVKLTGGGTDFVQAFGKVQQILSNGSQQVPVVIFMTDGQDQRIAAVTTLVEQIHQQFAQMMLFSIAFSDYVDIEQIKAITRAGNGGMLERTSQGKTYQMVISCKDKLQLIQAFQTVSGACNQLDEIKALIETLKEQRQKMIEDNKKSTEEYYKLHEDMIVQQLQSRKNIQTKVTENSRDSHIDSLIQEVDQRKKKLEEENRKLEEDETTFNEELKNEENKRNQYQEELDHPNLTERITTCQAEEKRIIKIFEEGKDKQTESGYDILNKEQLSEMNHSIESLLSMADDVKHEYSQMKTFIQGIKDSLLDTETILKDINIDLVKLNAMKEQGFYEILIEFGIYKEEDIYPDGREGKLYPKTVTAEILSQLYESLLKQQLEKNPDLLDQLIEILGTKEALLSDLNARIDTKVYKGGYMSSSTTESDILEEEDTETQQEAMMMKIYEVADQDYADLVKEVKENEREIRKIKKEIQNYKSAKYLEKNSISKDDAKEHISEKNEELKDMQAELKDLKKQERDAGKDLKGPIKTLTNAAQMLRQAVERKILQIVEEKPRSLLKYQYYIFQGTVHENVTKFMELLRDIANKKP